MIRTFRVTFQAWGKIIIKKKKEKRKERKRKKKNLNKKVVLCCKWFGITNNLVLQIKLDS